MELKDNPNRIKLIMISNAIIASLVIYLLLWVIGGPLIPEYKLPQCRSEENPDYHTVTIQCQTDEECVSALREAKCDNAFSCEGTSVVCQKNVCKQKYFFKVPRRCV